MNVIATFNTPVSGINSSNVFLKKHSDGSLIPCTASVSADGLTVTLTPNGSLTTLSQYDVVIQNLVNKSNIVQSPNPFTSTFSVVNAKTASITESLGAVTTTIAKKHKFTRTVTESSISVSEAVVVSKSHPASYSVSQSGSSFSSFFDSSGTTNIAYGEVASVANSLTGSKLSSITFTYKSQNNSGIGGIGVNIKIINAAGSVVYTFASPPSLTTDASAHTVTIADTGNTHVMSTGDAIVITWDSGGGNHLSVAINTGGTFSSGAFYNGSTITDDGSNDLAATIT